MTITVSVEDLADYQQKIDAWLLNRSKFCADFVLRSMSMRDMMYRSDPENEAKFYVAVAKWDKENPAPRLLPNL